MRSNISIMKSWQFVEKEKFVCIEENLPPLKREEVLVEIAGCGICSSDCNVFFGRELGIKRSRALGHEISGKVIDGDKRLIGKEIIIPPVMPCHSCEICFSGRENRCLNAKIPGYNMGRLGGNSSHIIVPSKDLCILNKKRRLSLAYYSVVSDAVASAYYSLKRADIKKGDKVVIIGATGNAGVYATQFAKLFGAKEVVAIARDKERLRNIMFYGATKTISSVNKTAKEVKQELFSYCLEKQLDPYCNWKIIEWSGSSEGQKIAIEILSFASRLVIAGCGKNINSIDFSKVMIFEAEIVGSWACPPRYLPEILNLIDQEIDIENFTYLLPMSEIDKAYRLTDKGIGKRIVLVPDF
ncbi:alcohol dehydrogenase catalytic domain-containing protein [Enterococcus faecium]|nr:alcohol dehydrogenase catalytic domain-containing protein [Enterococcus faecium]